MMQQGLPTVKMAYLIRSRVFPTDPVELEPVLVKMYNDIAVTVNVRTIGIYDTIQVVTGERWFNPKDFSQARQSYRQVYPLGAVAAGTTLTTPHGLEGVTAFTHIYGDCLTSVPDHRPLPYASVTANANIELKVVTPNIVISVGAASPNIVAVTIVLEYLLN